MMRVKECFFNVLKETYENARSRVRINDTYSNEFKVKVGLHQGFSSKPFAIHNCVGGAVTRDPHRQSFGVALCG